MDQAKLSDDILQYRSQDHTFQKSIQSKSSQMIFNFYDGPPFASGDPHYGHLLASSIKDAVARYMTMKGYRVPRIRGWDCHGMPAESFVEKKLGLQGKKDIEMLGVQQFVEACRESVRQVNDNRKWFVDHIGRWVDLDHAYYTMDLHFMESVINCFSCMYQDNLIYKGFKIQGYCPSCATGLSNRDILEGYQMRNDPTAIVTFPIVRESDESKNTKREADGECFARDTDGSVQYVTCVIKNTEGGILSFYNNYYNHWQFVAGHVDTGETIEQATLREIQEELGVSANIVRHLGSLKWKSSGRGTNYFVEVELADEPKNMEPHKHGQMEYVQIVPSDNSHGRGYQVNNLIVEDEHEINQFMDLKAYHLLTTVFADRQPTPDAQMSFLAWTTTPWTLPSNMFVAVGADIRYAQIYDFARGQYYILAESLIDTLYSDKSDYVIIRTCPGSQLQGMRYKPLFDYYHHSTIDQHYKNQVHQVLVGDFVSTADGVGIVHIAPAFGEDDYQISAQKLGKDTVQDRLLMPVNQYGEFTDQVPDFAGLKVHDANKPILEYLKQHNRIFKIDQISHSYPHCRRCDSPLIYRAITSRFVQETKLAPDNIAQASKLNFVPESIKARFINGLESAPDRNISRNRYRGCPLPVWEAVDGDHNHEKIVVGSLDQLYQLSRTGSRNISKFVFIRHGKTDYNLQTTQDGYMYDSFGKAQLTDLGIQQSQQLAQDLHYEKDFVVYLSPLPRVIHTAAPWIMKYFDFDIINSPKYQELYNLYQQYRSDGSLTNLEKIANVSHEIYPNIIIDFRLGEEYHPQYQDKKLLFESMKRDDESLGGGVSTIFNFQKTRHRLEYVCQKHQSQTVVVFAHGNNGMMLDKCFSDFDFDSGKITHTPKNATPMIFYYDHDRQTSVDLHLPYIDNYRFEIDGIQYRRIPEVLDCRFESGAMPFGQFHKLDTDRKKFTEYPADFIAEGLDQTRGWFRTLHIVGNAIMGSNSYRNVIVNGLILAEDGKKMSKKLKNYPDPKELLNKYGADAFRLYVLGSPVVKAEPLRFSEKGVEQIYKDVIMPLHNVVKFFEMYAKIDEYQDDGTQVYFMRHTQDESKSRDAKVTEIGYQQLQDPILKEQILTIDPDIIITSDFDRTIVTAQAVQNHIHTHGKQVEIVVNQAINLDHIDQTVEQYQTICKEYAGKKILIVRHHVSLQKLWKQYCYGQTLEAEIENCQIIKLPTYQINSELDKHILAELHQTIDRVNTSMATYNLDDAVRSAIAFVDILSNRYIRRSRRRFRASGMEGDKVSAYHTLYEVITTYLRLLAPMMPFNTEYLWQTIKQYEKNRSQTSIHLASYPLASSTYINQQLLDEITQVRKIISMTLYLRAKNQIKLKQPLQTLEIKI